MRWRECWRRSWFSLPMRSGKTLPASNESQPSVHVLSFQRQAEHERAELLSNWERLFEIRDDVLRTSKKRESPNRLAAHWRRRLCCRPRGDARAVRTYGDELRYLFIVSQVELARSGDSELRISGFEGGRREVRTLLELLDTCGRVGEVSDCLRTLR